MPRHPGLVAKLAFVCAILSGYGSISAAFEQEVVRIQGIVHSACLWKRINVEWVQGLVGVQSRRLREQADLLPRPGRQAPMELGIALRYPWIEAVVKVARARAGE